MEVERQELSLPRAFECEKHGRMFAQVRGGGGGCEEEMRVGDRGSSAEEASYTRVQCSLVCNSRVAPPSRILLLPLHKRCLWKLRGHLVAFQPLFSIHFGSATAQMSGWSQSPGFVVVPPIQGMGESSYGVAFSPVAPTLLQLCSSSDIALFQTRVWIPPHQNNSEGATNPSDHLWPIADKAKGWKALWIEGERKERDTAFFFFLQDLTISCLYFHLEVILLSFYLK